MEVSFVKRVFALIFLTALSACGASVENDPIYKQLRANPPTEVPPEVLRQFKKTSQVCTMHNEGKLNQYMTCWYSSGRPARRARLSYIPANLLFAAGLSEWRSPYVGHPITPEPILVQ